MIMSVSMLTTGKGAATPVSFTNLSMTMLHFSKRSFLNLHLVQFFAEMKENLSKVAATRRFARPAR
ncbi:hypothetical protein RHECNPAF_3340088 [Rhizobium etli CNPAF512]|nr:hypothetical protein RHECNPAF_3340088 [Rhizobium etli CNPAF512]